MRVVAQRLEHRGLAGDLLDLRVQRCAVALVIDELVDEEARHQRSRQPVPGVAALLPALDALAVTVPEVGGQLSRARVEEVGVLEDVVVEIVLGEEADGTRLEAHVDVLRHQHHGPRRMRVLQCADHAEDLVVGFAGRQRGRQRLRHRMRLEVEAAAGILVAECRERDAEVDVVVAGRADQRVERATHLARVACDFGHALLVIVEFLERHHRQIDVVFLEAEQRGRVVHQHVGVEHEHLDRVALRLAARARLEHRDHRGRRGDGLR